MTALDGSVVLVAGASSGMGRAIALDAARAGARVCVVARREDLLATLLEEIRDAGGEGHAVVADLRDGDSARVAVEAAVATFGRLDALVNAVGTNIPDRSLDDLTPQRWRELVDANLDPAFALTQAVVPTLVAAGGGLIVHVSSAAAKLPDRSGVGYQASKAGVAALAFATSQEVQDQGVRVTVLYPGMTDTDLLRQRPTPPTDRDLARALQPEDVASLCTAVLALPARVHVPEVVVVPTVRA